MESIEIKPFVTCIVIEVGIFESEIIEERHFRDREEAAQFAKTLPAGLVVVVADV